MPEITHIALDGSEVRIAGPALDLNEPPTTNATLRILSTHRQYFSSGSLSFGPAVAREIAEVTLAEEYSFQGGRLRMGAKYDPDNGETMRVAVWEATGTSLYTVTYGTSAADLIGLLDLFLLSEAAGAVVLRPKDPTTSEFDEGPSLLKGIGGAFLDVVRLSDRVIRELPPWPGTPVLGGELFADTLGGGRQFFVLVTPTARVRVMPEAQSSDAETLQKSSQLEVEWRGA